MTRSRTPSQTAPGPVLWPVAGAAAGLLSVLLGIAGGLLETALSGPWPATGDPAYGPFLARNRGPVLAQSMLFVLGQAALVCFLGWVWARLLRAEGAPGTVSAVAFGAGFMAAALNIAGQGVQLVLTMPAAASMDAATASAVTDLCVVLLALANLPLAVSFAAVAALSLARGAYPRWLGGIAAGAAVAALLSVLSLVPTAGPLSPMGGLTTALRLVPLLWYLPAAVVMLRSRS
ncbi:hypothetical protein ACH9D2_14740 [Kocuria sp. M4R2S49]|uniref:hypothetical protein n=1 Tax=Kocuria rhizosphaericola TaxID=3376284 RepID=UPI00379EB57A